MIYRPLGRSGLQVSIIGLGTVKLGRTEGVKYPTAFDIPDDDVVIDLLACARDEGINLIDTAPAYGVSETRLGPLLRKVPANWLICTKVGETFENGRSNYDFSEAHTRTSVERSLNRLQREQLDIVLIHSDGSDLEILRSHGTLDVLKDLRSQGKVRTVGMSVKSAVGLEAAISHGADVVMATLNQGYLEERAAIIEAGRQGVGVLVKKALASGHADPNALSWVASTPGVSSIVVGTINPAHLQDNCRKATTPESSP